MTGAEPQSQMGIIVSSAVLQLKRLTRDLRVRVRSARVRLGQTVTAPNVADRARREMFAGHIGRMHEPLRVPGKIVAASRSAVARSDPAELAALRDQLLVYLTAFESARHGGTLSDAVQASSFMQPKTGSLTSRRPE